MSNPAVNGFEYANLLQNSYLETTLSLKGDEVWSSHSSEHERLGDPLLVSVSKGNLYIVCRSGVFSVSPENGKVLWTMEVWNSLLPQVTLEGVPIIDHLHVWHVIGLDGSIKRMGRLPILYDTFIELYFLSEPQFQFLLTNRFPDSFDKKIDDGLVVTFFDVPEQDIVLNWEHDKVGLSFVFPHNSKHAYVLTEEEILKIPVPTNSARNISKLKMPGGRSMSMDHSGRFMILRVHKGKNLLTCADIEGKVIWDCDVDPITVPTHPPACSPGGVVYCALSGNLLAIKDGAILWKERLSQEALKMTVLQDETILVTTSTHLYHISKNGEILSSLLVKIKPTCRPLVDSEGRVFVAGRNGISCFK